MQHTLLPTVGICQGNAGLANKDILYRPLVELTQKERNILLKIGSDDDTQKFFSDQFAQAK